MGAELNLELGPYAPAEMAQRVESSCVEKAKADVGRLLALGVLAGAFIALGAAFATCVSAGSTIGFGPTRLLSGVAFSMGLILVVVGGGELFTGNNLLVMAWLHRRVTIGQVLRNWAFVYVGNFLGASLTAWGCHLSGIASLGGSQVGQNALQIALTKVNLSWDEAFFRGVFCNALVCLAIWLSYSARSTTDKVLAVLFPIVAFVALGFEHSVANMYFIPYGLMLDPSMATTDQAAGLSQLTWMNYLWRNLLPVTLGNIVGGAGLVGVVYWFVYLRGKPTKEGA
jgi:formate transporter